MKNSKRWFIRSLIATVLLLLVMASVIVVIDPFFHYHLPLDFLSYPIDKERYQNDGMLRHFSYDAVITGTSMTENFLCSQFDALWDANSIKLPLSGALYKETDQQLRRAIRANSNIRFVLRSLDQDMLLKDKDSEAYTDYPTYLYDDNPFNDVQYVLNKQILLEDVARVMKYTVYRMGTTPRDHYANWMVNNRAFGKETVLECYERPTAQEPVAQRLSLEQRDMLLQNLEQNVLETVRDNPDISFIFFFAPYSVCYWHQQWAQNTVFQALEAERAAIEALLPYDNVQLFGFDDAFSVSCNLSLYTDCTHYDGETSKWIMQCLHDGEHRLNQQNYRAYLDTVYDFYSSYDYDSLYQSAA